MDNSQNTGPKAKTSAAGFTTHNDLDSYLEQQSEMEAARKQRQENEAVARRALEEQEEAEEQRKKEQQKQTFTSNEDKNEEPETVNDADPFETNQDKNDTPDYTSMALVRALCDLYEVPALTPEYLPELNNFQLHSVTPDTKHQDKPVMVAIVHNNCLFEVTKTSVITQAGLNAQAAYDLALQARLNPEMVKNGVTMLPGDDADRVFLYHAATALGLIVKNAEELTAEQRAHPPAEWAEFMAKQPQAEQPKAKAEEKTAETVSTGYEEIEPEQVKEPEVEQGLSQENQPVETGRYGNDYFNSTYPAPKQIHYSEGAYDPVEAAKIPTLTDIVTDEDGTAEPEKSAETPAEEKNAPVMDAIKAADERMDTLDEGYDMKAALEHANEIMGSPEESPQDMETAPAKAEVTAKDAIKAPISEETMTALFNANVDKKTYMAIREKVIDEQKASRSFLRDAFDLKDRQAKTVQAALRDENIIAKEGSNRHVILVQP